MPPPLKAADNVVLNAYMGAWYVIAYTPLFVDKDAHNPVEHYSLNDQGHIEVTYRFMKGGPNGPQKSYQSRAYVPDISHSARWKIQFLWPFRADFVIIHLSENGQETIVAHPNRKYAWIMQRRPEIDEAIYNELLAKLEAQGFSRQRLRRAAHDWIET